MPKLNSLFEKLGIEAKDTSIYAIAFTHSSCNVSEAYHRDYEKLEFMGDAVISFVVSSMIFTLHGGRLDQGKMTKMRSELVQKKSLARIGRSLGFQNYIKFGPSIKVEEKDNDRFLEDVFEAFIGALFLDLGIHTAARFIEKSFKPLIENFSFDLLTDYKSELQEAIQAESREALRYVVVKEEGPSHDRTFTVEVYLDRICLGVGTGKTKKTAEQNAAKAALNKKAG